LERPIINARRGIVRFVVGLEQDVLRRRVRRGVVLGTVFVFGFTGAARARSLVPLGRGRAWRCAARTSKQMGKRQ
jgi:hypothetical protein